MTFSDFDNPVADVDIMSEASTEKTDSYETESSGMPPYLGEPIAPSPQQRQGASSYEPAYHPNDRKQTTHQDSNAYISENIKLYVAQHPEYREVYHIPAIQNAVNAYIDGNVKSNGSLALQDLVEALNYFVDIRNALTGNPNNLQTVSKKALNNNSKTTQKLRSTVDAPGAVHNASRTPSIRSGQQTVQQPSARETAWREALKLSPQEYTRWERDPKNRAIVEWVLSQDK